MSRIANKLIVLTLNGSWLPTGMLTVKKALKSMIGGTYNCPPSLGLDIEYELDENGRPNTDKVLWINPVKWGQWVELPIRSWDLTISSVNRVFRVPTVIVNSHFTKMPMRKVRPTKMAIAERDNWICQVSGQKLTRSNANIDHVIPRSRGGKNTWTNMVLCHKDLNSAKGNKLNEEIGYKLIRQPKEPMATPLSAMIKDVRHHDWKHFVVTK